MSTHSIMIDPKHPAKKDGSRYIVLRITNNGIRHYISLGISVKPEHWLHKESRFKKAHNKLHYKELNHDLTKYSENAEKILSELKLKNIPFSLDHFKDLLFGSKDSPTVSEFWTETVNIMKERGEIGNSRVYKHAQCALKKFTGRDDLTFQEITPSFLEAFETYLRKSGEPRTMKPGKDPVKKKERAGNTIHNYMRTIRALYNKAIEAGLVKQEIYPFYNNYTHKGYRFNHLKKATSKRALSEEEITKLKDFQPGLFTKEENAKLLFMFSYYTWGMNMVDMLQLKWDQNIQGDYIIYSRTKTRHTKNFPIPILPPIREILDHFRKFTTGNMVFPFISEGITDPEAINTRVRTMVRNTNRVLSEMGKDLGIKTPISTNVARHTFATTLKRKNVSVATIQEMMGHPKEETTRIYLGEFGIGVLDEASKHLLL